ncbi:MAG: PilZ domain-containing protein [Planctomycetota bacterium]
MAERVQDRRRHPRVDLDVGAVITSAEGGFEAQVKNISLSGLLLYSSRSVEEMTIVGMRLSLPAQPERNMPAIVFEISGAVVRCDPVEDGSGRYELAVFLTDMPRESREALHDFIKHRTT